MFKDLKIGQTHSFDDGCQPAHERPEGQTDFKELDKKLDEMLDESLTKSLTKSMTNENQDDDILVEDEDDDEPISLATLAGELFNAAKEAAEKKLEQIMKKGGYETAYWDTEFEMKITQLNSDFKPYKQIKMSDVKVESEE